MEVQARDGRGVRAVDVMLVKSGFSPGAIVSIRFIHVAFFCPNPELGGFVRGEIECRDGDLVRLRVCRMAEFERFLEGETVLVIS